MWSFQVSMSLLLSSLFWDLFLLKNWENISWSRCYSVMVLCSHWGALKCHVTWSDIFAPQMVVRSFFLDSPAGPSWLCIFQLIQNHLHLTAYLSIRFQFAFEFLTRKASQPRILRRIAPLISALACKYLYIVSLQSFLSQIPSSRSNIVLSLLKVYENLTSSRPPQAHWANPLKVHFTILTWWSTKLANS